MALPKRSTDVSNTYADPHSDSETSPTTSPEHSSKQEDSDPNYTPNYEEPNILQVQAMRKRGTDFSTILTRQPWNKSFDYELLDAFIQHQLEEKRDITSFWRPQS